MSSSSLGLRPASDDSDQPIEVAIDASLQVLVQMKVSAMFSGG
jgi:hypothetical protein